MKKRILSLLLVAVMMFTMMPITATAEEIASGTCGDNLTWTLDDSGTLTISGEGAMENYWYSAPWYSVGYYNSITEVVVTDGVTSIGDYAFYGCQNLTTVTIPTTVTSIGYSSFEGCTNLSSVVIPEGVTSIGNGAFFGCQSLTSITIPDSVVFVDEWAFKDCTSLVDVYYGGSKFGWNAIDIGEDNSYLTSATIHYAVSVISGACGDNLTWTLDNEGTLTISGEGAIEYMAHEHPWGAYASYIKSVVIEEGVTSICQSALGTAYDLSYDYSNITNITIPSSVTFIAGDPFIGLDSLLSIDVDPDNNNYCSVDGVLFDKSLTTLHQFPAAKAAEYVIPDGVTDLGYGAFWECSNLTSIIIPDGVTDITSYAFLRCTGLTSVTIPGSVTQISMDAFAGCSNLQTVTILDGVTYISMEAFSNCTSLTSIIIPDSVTSVGFDAFWRCDGLSDVYYGGSEEQWAAITVDEGNESLTNATIHYNYVPIIASGICGDNLTWTLDEEGTLTISGEGEMWNYTQSAGQDTYAPWDMFKESVHTVVINEGVTSIGDCAFSDCQNLTSVTLPDGVTSIGRAAFQYCSNLASITIPDSVTTIDEYAFVGCDSLASVTIPDSVTNIGNGAFENCDSLTSITIPDSVTFVSPEAFYLCDNLSDVYYGGSEEQWAEIFIDYNNECLLNAMIHYNSTIVADEAVAPTCTETGLTEGTHCSCCGETVSGREEIPALGHAEVVDEAVAPTCTETGLTEGKHCSVCGEVLVEQEEIEALGHTEVVDEAVAPTCTETGLTEGKHCSVCGEVLVEQEEIAALGHTEVIDEAVAPTCTEVGYTEGKHCSTCGEVFVEQEEIPALGHNYVDNVCVNCGDVSIIFGDLNEDVEITAVDAAMVYSIVNGKLNADEGLLLAADVNGDEEVTAVDAAMIYSYVNGKLDSFPIE